jgi:hypothetical protein
LQVYDDDEMTPADQAARAKEERGHRRAELFVSSAVELADLSPTIESPQSAARRATRPFVFMLVCSAVIVIGLLTVKLLASFPGIPYVHLLVNYDFGVIKRALVGAMVSLLRPRVGLVDVYVVGLAAWLATLVAYLAVFRRTFGFSERTIPLLAVILSSPCFFKNFMFSIGYFDVLGCLAVLIALLLPVNLALPLIMGVIACILLFIHHLHLLLYIPTIGLVVLLRMLAEPRINLRAALLAGLVVAVAISSAFYFLAFHGSVPVPVDQFTAALRARAIDSPEKIGGYLVQIFYTDIAHELEETMKGLPSNALRFPIYPILIFLHLPLISYFRRLTLALTRHQDRRLVVAGVVGVTIGYVIIGVFVFDYPRWVSNWAVCMILIMHAVRLLPSTLSDPVAIDPTLSKNRWFGWILALIPRVGISKPF